MVCQPDHVAQAFLVGADLPERHLRQILQCHLLRRFEPDQLEGLARLAAHPGEARQHRRVGGLCGRSLARAFAQPVEVTLGTRRQDHRLRLIGHRDAGIGIDGWRLRRERFLQADSVTLYFACSALSAL